MRSRGGLSGGAGLGQGTCQGCMRGVREMVGTGRSPSSGVGGLVDSPAPASGPAGAPWPLACLMLAEYLWLQVSTLQPLLLPPLAQESGEAGRGRDRRVILRY